SKQHFSMEPLTGAPLSAMSLPEAFDELAGALGSDPWLDRYPLVGRGTVRSASPRRLEGAGVRVPFVQQARPWELLAAGGGEEWSVVVEWTPHGLIPLAIHTADGMVTGTEARV